MNTTTTTTTTKYNVETIKSDEFREFDHLFIEMSVLADSIETPVVDGLAIIEGRDSSMSFAIDMWIEAAEGSLMDRIACDEIARISNKNKGPIRTSVRRAYKRIYSIAGHFLSF